MKKNVRRLSAAFGVVMTSVMLSLGASAGDVTTDRLVNSEKEPGNWLNHHGNLEAHRFSGLDQINAKNQARTEKLEQKLEANRIAAEESTFVVPWNDAAEIQL